MDLGVAAAAAAAADRESSAMDLDGGGEDGGGGEGGEGGDPLAMLAAAAASAPAITGTAANDDPSLKPKAKPKPKPKPKPPSESVDGDYDCIDKECDETFQSAIEMWQHWSYEHATLEENTAMLTHQGQMAAAGGEGEEALLALIKGLTHNGRGAHRQAVSIRFSKTL